MPLRHIAGSSGEVRTDVEILSGDRNGQVIVIQGPYEILKGVSAERYVPTGFSLSNSRLTSDGRGGGRMTLTCEPNENEYLGSTPFKVMYKITMESVTKDLRMHPEVADSSLEIGRWLATDTNKRMSSDGKYQWVDEDDVAHEISENSAAGKFIQAYLLGIESYVTHYPVIEKISHYKSIPGCSTYMGKMTGGNAQFSGDIDKWSSPGISLSGYNADGWFKSGDGYEQDGGKSWIRTEQWTWTPQGRSSELGWIYS